MPITRPAGIAVRTVFAVHMSEVDILGQWKFLIKRHTNDVGIMMPNMEAAILPLGKEQIATVGTDTRQRDTPVIRGSIVHQFLIAKSV